MVTSLEERVATTPALALSAPVTTQQIAGARRISFFIMAEVSRRFPSAYRDFFTEKEEGQKIEFRSANCGTRNRESGNAGKREVRSSERIDRIN
jgi:hypothetical protein